MDVEQALAFTDALVFAKSGVHLSDLQQAMLRESWSWQRQSYDQIADAYGYSPTYLKHDVGPKLWKLLSGAIGEKVNKTNFRAAIERKFQIESIAQPLPLPTPAQATPPSAPIIQSTPIAADQDWGDAPDINFFYGREAELSQLEQWIAGDSPACRLVAVLGMGGMGKTSLAIQLAQRLQPQFERIVWRSLRNAPALSELLFDLLQCLSNEPEAHQTIERQISQLLHELRSHRCLLILDNVETILPDRTSSSFQNYQSYGNLFRLIGETRHQSCLLITSREKPPEVALLEGETLPVRSLPLKGLQTSEVQELMKLKGNFKGSDSEWNRLIAGYSGNPLALKIISTTIQTLFDGSLADFLQQDTFVFGNIRALVEQQFECLSRLEKTVMYWLAIYREPAAFTDLRTDIFPAISPQRLIEVLELLEQRSLVEKQGALFSLQPVVMEYVSDRLITQICLEIQAYPNSAALLNHHALLHAQSKDYIRETQIRLILTPILDRLLNDLQGDSLEDYLLQRLMKLRGQPASEVGYAGGNLLNLLCRQQTNLSNHDFSQLTLWQADLRQVQLHTIDFTQTDLSRSLFTEILGIVFTVALSPDGTQLATGDAEGGLRLWQVRAGKLLLTLEGHQGWVWSVAFSADGQTLASCSSDKTIRLWDLQTGQCLQTLHGHSGSIWSVAFSPDGTLLASGGDESAVMLWDLRTGELAQQLPGHTGSILSVAFATADRLASGSADGTIRLWDLPSAACRHLLRGHTDRIWSVASSPDGEWLVSGSADRTIRLWSIATGECLKAFEEHTDRVRSVKFGANGQTIVSSSDDQTVRVWDVSTGQCLNILRGHTNSVFAVALSADEQMIASGSTDQTVRLWNAQTGRCLKTLTGYTNSVFAVVFSPDGQTIASGSTDQTLRLWDSSTGQCRQRLSGHQGWVTSVAFHPDGDRLASSSADQTVKLWDARTGECLKTLQGHTNWVQSVAFSPDGELLASGGDDRILRLWSLKTEQVQTWQGHTGWIWSVAFSPDREILASSSEDATIRLWSIQTGACLRTLAAHTSRVKSIAFSPNGQLLASASDDETVRLWSVRTGECLKTLQGHLNNVWSVAFSPDGTVLASGSLDQTVRLWQVESGTCLETLSVLNHSVRSTLAFNPIPQTHDSIATGSHNGTIQIWNTEGQCLQTLTPDSPYKGTNITRVTGITEAQKMALKTLGAIEQ